MYVVCVWCVCMSVLRVHCVLVCVVCVSMCARICVCAHTHMCIRAAAGARPWECGANALHFQVIGSPILQGAGYPFAVRAPKMWGQTPFPRKQAGGTKRPRKG